MKVSKPKYVNHGGWDTKLGDRVTVNEREGLCAVGANHSNGFGYYVDVVFPGTKGVRRFVHTQVQFHRRQGDGKGTTS